MKEENKCEKLGMSHAWRNEQVMWGFEAQNIEVCVNCDLKRTRHSEIKEWWSYSDGRPKEQIFNTRPI